MKQYLQSGGSMYFGTIASDIHADDAAATSESSKVKFGNDDGLISEKLMMKLMEKGIPVDVDNFMNKLADFEHKIDMGMDVNKRALYSLQAEANRIIQQAEYLKTAEDHAEDNESWNEYAVGNRGELYTVTDKGDIKAISSSEYDQSKHGPALTVGDLVQHRKFNSTQAFDIDLTRAINDNIGMSKISEYIQKIVTATGTAENTNEAYIDLASYIGREAAKKPTKEQFEALQRVAGILQNGGTDTLFKIKDTQEGKNLQEAYNYILQVLPRSMKLQLIGRNAAAGNGFDTGNKYVSDLIIEALGTFNKTRDEHYVTYDVSLNKAAGTQAGNADQNRNLGVLEQLVQGSLGQRDYKLINSQNPSYSLELHGTGVGNLATFDNKIVDKTPLSIALKAGLAPLVDKNHITMGSQKISTGQLDSILYNGGDVINVWAPVNAEGDVDLEQLATLSAIQDICKNNPQLTLEDKQTLLDQHGLSGHFDERGVFHGDPNTMAQFLVMTGVTSDEIIDTDINPFADKMSKADKKAEFEQIERIYGQLNKDIKGKGKFEFQTGWFNATTDLYRAPIFMKLNHTAQIDVGTFSGKGPMVKTPTYQQQLAYDQIQNSQPSRQLTTPSTSALYE